MNVPGLEAYDATTNVAPSRFETPEFHKEIYMSHPDNHLTHQDRAEAFL